MADSKKMRSCARLWDPLVALRSLVHDGEFVRGRRRSPSLPPSASALRGVNTPPARRLDPRFHPPHTHTHHANHTQKKGGRSEGALTGVRALALLHVIAQHAVILACARGADLAAPFSAAAAADDDNAGPGGAPNGAVNEFLTSWPAQPVMVGDVGVDAFFTLSGCAWWWLMMTLLMTLASGGGGGKSNISQRCTLNTPLSTNQPTPTTTQIHTTQQQNQKSYLIALMWLKEVQRGVGGGGRFNYGRFMARRLLRIWPAMALALAVTWGFVHATRGSTPWPL